MIAYPIDPAELIARIEQEKPGWLARARDRKDAYAQARAYVEGGEFWGEIKGVYIALQHEKCAYCEMKLAGKAYAAKVHEVEHFRPKSRLRAWPGDIKRLKGYTPPCATGGASATGYYLHAYNPFNYAIACTRCNSSLKSDYFPVRGTRNFREEDAGLLRSEDPLLVYPIAGLDVDPAELITFIGVLAVPVHAAGPLYERAEVTIRFFDLNHEDLTTRRAEVIAALYLALRGKELAADAADIRDFSDGIARYLSPATGFSACAAAYYALYQKDRSLAVQIGREAQKLLPR
ncbi:hypothetical protein GCM10027277_29140 [Pseudoduganella ginsengisoli]|uniref:TIGR02646 family protein n=1 Tax=Pseudoduganella ginsengisoli TaxID=1462440 RepID=A0A6L6Q062_9BURK|nr:hypothetical protein [Pseudoduganella ginsengisoli]MTW03015.1 hypothetical protein [Pseudoduganella ginsengisoli]